MRDTLYPVIIPALKVALPLIAGVIGTMLFVFSPESHAAFCVVKP